MGYDGLRSRLAGELDCRDIVTLPDGSVDRYYAVTDATGDAIPTQDAFADRLADGAVRSLRLVPEAVRAGGEAVNTATQVHHLGQDVRLYGHLDDPELGPFPFPTTSMGTPATVHVLAFDREELMLSVESPDICSWTLPDLFATAGVDPDDWIDDGVVVVQNWVGFPEMTDALRDLTDVDLGGATLIFDPGDITTVGDGELEALCDVLTAVGNTTEVILSANEAELARLAGALAIEADGTDREVGLRAALGVAAVVRHDEACAVAVSGEVTSVENVDSERIVRRTGAGDRFDGGLAVGIAAGLPWEEVLALGNACAAYFVENGETATREDIITLLESRPRGG
jgi:sugar/nucleoside kinase (ribokinase family)